MATRCTLKPSLTLTFSSAEHMALANQDMELVVPVSYLEIEPGLSPCSVEQLKGMVSVLGFVCAVSLHNQYAS